jgi:hypothetical protein
VPGRLYHKPVNNCSREEFIEEVKAQILSCGALDELIWEANNGKSLHEFALLNVEVWHEWEFGPDGIKHPQPKWVTTTNTQAYLPAQKTPVANLFLAGAHTQTQAQVWSIEGAVESGRRAAKAIDDRVQVLEQYKPQWIKISAKIDDGLYALKAPHLIDSVFILVILFFLWQLFI